LEVAGGFSILCSGSVWLRLSFAFVFVRVLPVYDSLKECLWFIWVAWAARGSGSDRKPGDSRQDAGLAHRGREGVAEMAGQ